MKFELHNRRWLPAAAALLATVILAAAQVESRAQRTRLVGTSTRKRQDAPKVQSGMYVFGDITLKNYVSVKGNPDQVRAVGPKVTVDSVDPKTGSETHMTAREFVATMGDGGVEKLEAIGAMTFDGRRPAIGRKGLQTFQGSGSKSTYFKKAGRLEIEGPVNYFVEQPTTTGDAKQSVRGTAERAIYDENKKTVTLIGSVVAKVMDPTALRKESNITADEAILDFSEAKVQFEFKNRNPEGGELKFNPKIEPRKDEKKDVKKGGA
jgi:lipopolysaccharide export system protein LptA